MLYTVLMSAWSITALCLTLYSLSVLELKTDVQVPHGTHGVQHHLVPPEPFIQYRCQTVGFVGQRTLEGGSLLLNAIVGLQHHMLVVPGSLAVLDQPNDHLPAKVSGWIEGVIMSILVSNPQALLDGCKKAISITIHLQLTPLVSRMDKATTALDQKMLVKMCTDGPRYMQWTR